MKKLSIITSVTVAVLLFTMMAWAAPIGKITGITGHVDITPAGAAQARKLAVEDTVSSGDIIRTKSKSKAEVSFQNGNILRLAENTRLKISDYMSGKEKNISVLSLLRGKIQKTVKTVGSTGGRYEVHTPTSVCGVRGTIFYNSHVNGVSVAAFQEGEGYGYNLNLPQNIQTITAGQAMLVSGVNQPPQVRSFSPGELNALKQETDPSSPVFQTEPGNGINNLNDQANKLDRLNPSLDKFEPSPGQTKPYVQPVFKEPHKPIPMPMPQPIPPPEPYPPHPIPEP